MPGSISMGRRQKELVESNFLDLSGSSQLDYEPVSLDTLSDQLTVWAFAFAEKARENLNRADRVASGMLSDSIIPTEVTVFGQVYQIGIKVSDYYKFVDQGVKGWQDENGGNSPYQFKHYTGRSGQKNSQMVTALRKWLIKEGLKGTGKENRHPRASRRDQHRATITDTSTTMAIILSKSIRKKGIKPSHFWTNTMQEMTQQLKDDLGKALKIDILNNLIPSNGNRS